MSPLKLEDLDSAVWADVVSAEKIAHELAYPAGKRVKVGCVIAAGDNRFVGANIKRLSWNDTTCAERMAADKALFGRTGKLDRIVIYASYGLDGGEPLMPCGVCREILTELITDLGQADVPVFSVNANKSKVVQCTLLELLPNPVSLTLKPAEA